MNGRTSVAPLNMEAIHSDFTDNYVNPTQPRVGEAVTISIRTARNNVDAVWLVFEGGEYIDENLHSYTRIDLKPTSRRHTDVFDFYSATIPKLQGRLSYAFGVSKGGRTYYYNRRGVHQTVNHAFNFVVIAGVDTPSWAQGAIMYQIYVDRFHNGDPTNDVRDGEYTYLGEVSSKFESWEALPKKLDICNFAGGDLQGVIDKMDYLEGLGVEVIYLTPVFVSPSNHKYDIQDYDFIDPHIGVIVDEAKRCDGDVYAWRTTDKESLAASNALMAHLIEVAHKKGMKVILDGVFNHCGAHNKWMDTEGIYSGREGYSVGAYHASSSPYHNYFRWHLGGSWPNNDHYDAWWGHHNHPKLNYEGSKGLFNYIIEVGKKWVSPPFNADGWRMDVAADLGHSPEYNHYFWKEFRRAVKGVNPEAIILAEHYGDPTKWLQGDEWDTIMNYDAFMEPVTWFLTGMQKHSDEFNGAMLNNALAFEETMRHEMGKFSKASLYSAMNQLSNHDHSRFLTRTNMKAGRLHTHGSETAGMGVNKAVMAEAVVIQMTWPGAPTIYYGDEAGVVGWTDPDNRRTYPWGKEDTYLLELHRELAKIHKKYSSLRSGSLEMLHGELGVLAYARWNRDDRIVVVVNNNNEPRSLKIPVWRAEVGTKEMKLLLQTSANATFKTSGSVRVSDGFLDYNSPALSAVVLVG